LRKIFHDHEGGQGDAFWAFEKKGYLSFSGIKTDKEQEEIMEDAIQLGADDFEINEDEFNV
jgi:transcriptional/translational regulatory protein YebC/TACO1